jgi:hypothetical protein
MHRNTEKNERLSRRHSFVLAVGFHLAFITMLYFKMSSDTLRQQQEQLHKAPPAREQARA